MWDVVDQVWHTPDKMTDDADKLAADLNARNSKTGPRRDVDWRHFEPPVAIDIKFSKWEPAELDYWVREPDGWYGHVLRPRCEPRWYPAELLRPRRTDNAASHATHPPRE